MGFQSLAGDDGGRALLPALAFSVAIHFLLLWQAPSILPRQAGGMLLAATLRAAPAPAQTPATERGMPAARPEPKPVPSRAAVPVIATAPEAAARASAPATPGAVAAPPPLAAAGATASAAPAPAPAPGEPGPDADGIRDYRVGLARAARSHRRYPPVALERGWTGTAEIQVDVSRQGQAWQILLARSSGHEILDREALSMMSRAAAAAALPDSLRGHAFAVRLPVTFDIDEVR